MYGKTAYNNLGNLITGSHQCHEEGSYIYTDSDMNNNGKIIMNYIPNWVILYADKGDGNYFMYYYDKNLNSTKYYRIVPKSSTIELKDMGTTRSTLYKKDNKLMSYFNGTEWIGRTIYYMASK